MNSFDELEGEQQERDRKQNVKNERDRSDLKSILATAQGRRFLWRLFCLCGNFRMSFRPDALVTAFNEGQRNIGNLILGEAMGLDCNLTKLQKEYED